MLRMFPRNSRLLASDSENISQLFKTIQKHILIFNESIFLILQLFPW